ncbi:MAG: hypothetical protein IPN18_06890 [Ignavibacteriales bacterium]|nr:hypothetical protein [Ignavibacteriales bacterium]
MQLLQSKREKTVDIAVEDVQDVLSERRVSTFPFKDLWNTHPQLSINSGTCSCKFYVVKDDYSFQGEEPVRERRNRSLPRSF